jgi:uncharacterized protein YxeA
MKIIKIVLLSLPLLLISSAFAIGDYTFPQDVSTDTGTFPVKDDDDNKTKQLEMQKEEAIEEESNIDSFGQDKFNQNVDPDKVDTTKDTY